MWSCRCLSSGDVLARLVTAKRAKTAVHALLFLLAVVVFYLGLGVGLQVDPTLGTLLWAAAAVIAALNLFWLLRSHG